MNSYRLSGISGLFAATVALIVGDMPLMAFGLVIYSTSAICAHIKNE